MEPRSIEAIVEKTSQSLDLVCPDLATYGVSRLVEYRSDDFVSNGSAYVLARLEDPLCSKVNLQESQCVPVPQQLGVDEALLVPPLAMALSFWDRLHLELGEMAIYTEGNSFAELVGQVAIWRGGCPVIRLSNDPDKAPLEMGERQIISDPEEALHQLRIRSRESQGFAAIDMSGRPETIDLLLEVVPRWGRIMLAGLTRQPLTIDFYNNVHRKGVLLVSSVFDPSQLFEDIGSRTYLQSAFRILQNKEMAAVCSELLRKSHL